MRILFIARRSLLVAAISATSSCLISAPSRVRAQDVMPEHPEYYSTQPVSKKVNDSRFPQAEVNLSTRNNYNIYQGDMIVNRPQEDVPAVPVSVKVKAASLLKNLSPLKLKEPDADQILLQALANLPDGKSPTIDIKQGDTAFAFTDLCNKIGTLPTDNNPDLAAAITAFNNRARRVIQLGVGVSDAKYLWPQGIIPFYVDDSIVQNPGLLKDVYDAINHWNHTSEYIYLRRYKTTDETWVRFQVGQGCSSQVGKVADQGEQIITLAAGCEFDQVVHEIGHTVGLFHEQDRSDRDTYLTIHLENAIDGTQFNFTIAGLDGVGAKDVGDFDFASVMLYGPDAFASGNQPTMEVKDPYKKYIGNDWGLNHRNKERNLKGLSLGDVATVKSLYSKVYPDPIPDSLLEFTSDSAATTGGGAGQGSGNAKPKVTTQGAPGARAAHR